MNSWMQRLRVDCRWSSVVIVAEIVLTVGMLHVDGLFDHVGMDFLTSYTAAEMIADGAADDLYRTRAQWEYQQPIIEAYGVEWNDRAMHPYIAPPLLGIITLPLLAFSPATATAIWSATNALAAALGLWLLTRGMRVDLNVAIGIVVGSFPLYYVLMLGQVEGLLFLAFVIFVLAVRTGHDVRAGLAVAALAIKPPLLLAPLVYLAVIGRRRALWATVSAAAVQCVLSVALIGFDGVRDYVDLSRRLSGPAGSTVTNVWGMVNVRAIVVRGLPVDAGWHINILIAGLTLLVLLGSLAIWRRAGEAANGPAGLALLAVTTALTAYHALYHTAILAVLGLLLLVAGAKADGDQLRADRLTLLGWLCFTLAPLACFVVAQSSKLPAGIATVAMLLLWGAAAHALAAPAPVPVPVPARQTQRPLPMLDGRSGGG